jgi:hypothetical protein
VRTHRILQVYITYKGALKKNERTIIISCGFKILFLTFWSLVNPEISTGLQNFKKEIYLQTKIHLTVEGIKVIKQTQKGG